MKNKQSIFWGIVLIIIGIVFLGNNLNFWTIDIFFTGWWTLFIIVPSIYGILKKDYGSFISLALGILLLLAARDVITWSMIWKIFVPLLIIMIGFNLIFKPKLKRIKGHCQDLTAIFSDVDEKIKELNEDVRTTSIFGDIDLDLKNAKVTHDIIIECTTIFGDITLMLPKNVNININGTPIFGNIRNKYEEVKDGKYTINISYTCIFGDVEIL